MIVQVPVHWFSITQIYIFIYFLENAKKISDKYSTVIFALLWKDSRICIFCLLYFCQTSVDSVRAFLSDGLIVGPII